MSEELKATSIDSNEEKLTLDTPISRSEPDKGQRSSEELSKIPLSKKTIEKENLSRLVYLEKDSVFFSHAGCIKTKDGRLLPLRRLQKATGEISGKVLSYEAETNLGKLLVGKRIYNYFCETGTIRNQMAELVGKEACFHFWPTTNTAIEKAKFLKLSKVVDSLSKENGYIEVVGKLIKVFKGSFRVRLCSEVERKFFYIFFNDDYPYPDEEGEWVWLTGHVDLNTRQLKLDEASALAFPDENDATKLLERYKSRQLKNKRKNQRRIENKIKASAAESAESAESTKLTELTSPSELK